MPAASKVPSQGAPARYGSVDEAKADAAKVYEDFRSGTGQEYIAKVRGVVDRLRGMSKQQIADIASHIGLSALRNVDKEKMLRQLRLDMEGRRGAWDRVNA